MKHHLMTTNPGQTKTDFQEYGTIPLDGKWHPLVRLRNHTNLDARVDIFASGSAFRLRLTRTAHTEHEHTVLSDDLKESSFITLSKLTGKGTPSEMQVGDSLALNLSPRAGAEIGIECQAIDCKQGATPPHIKCHGSIL